METTVKKRNILGLPVAVLDKVGAVVLLNDALDKQKAIRLAFVNANLANMAKSDSGLHHTLQSFLLLNDGSGVGLASRWLYKELFPDNLNGTDFTPYFLNNTDQKLRIYLLGASPEVCALMPGIFQEKWPQHEVVGSQHGFFDQSKDGEVLSKIKEAKPNIVLIAMGNGLQEKWISRIVPDAAISAWGIGAFFDFLCHKVPRAPSWMISLGIEWVYRLYLEPKRMWRRYLIGNFKFVFYVLCQLMARKR